MELSDKLKILSDAAKYDVACTSSGTNRKGASGMIGNATGCGICHSFAADGRCISLLKILFTNDCVYDCKYCVNRISNDIPRATFTPREIADLTINFYKRNYIEGLFLSSAVCKNPNYTMELIYSTIKIVRDEYHFNGYIHIKAIPGADPAIIYKVGLIVDRMSVNIELPSEESLKLLAPQKSKESILKPMSFITNTIRQSADEKKHFRNAKIFAPAGQSTQLIIGATPDTDMKIIRLSEGLYNSYKLKRVFYSAFIPVSTNPLLPAIIKPPLLREHRLYQADWLLRFYGFKASELLDAKSPNFSLAYDPKCDWAIRNIDVFPVDVNKADYFTLLRVPGIGLRSAKKIIQARMHTTLDFAILKKLGIVLKRARFFIICKGKYLDNYKITQLSIAANLSSDKSILRDGNRGYLLGDGDRFRQNDLFLTDDTSNEYDMINVFNTPKDLNTPNIYGTPYEYDPPNTCSLPNIYDTLNEYDTLNVFNTPRDLNTPNIHDTPNEYDPPNTCSLPNIYGTQNTCSPQKSYNPPNTYNNPDNNDDPNEINEPNAEDMVKCLTGEL